MPPGIPYIVSNEAGERFCYYGLRGILVVVMTRWLVDSTGQKAPMGEAEAKSWYHLFVSAAYFFPVFGALLADAFWGKYRTILSLSAVYCTGCILLSVAHTKTALLLSLLLIAIGSGGIKPCVSAHVGDQFGAANAHLVSKVFGWFYLSINLGSSLSLYLVPVLLEKYGMTAAFGLPAAVMVLATFCFWSGRHKFVHIPAGGAAFARESFGPAGLRCLARLTPLFLFVAVFWSLYDQSSSAWVLQAEHLNLNWLGQRWQPAQLQVANPVLILILIPLFSSVVYPAIHSVFVLTPLRKIGIGLFVTVVSFLIPAQLEVALAHGSVPSVGWQILAYLFLTSGEVMVSVTFLEFSYTQAPKTMKSVIMALYLLSISLGNAFTALVNWIIERSNGGTWLKGPVYYLFFAGLMFAAAVSFVLAARRYRPETVLQQQGE
jgi:POT family proton-dependent oligopeptide transporter